MAHEQTPYRVGVCLDWATNTQAIADFKLALAMACGEATAKGIIDRNIDLVYREVEGAPFAMVQHAVDAWRELVHQEGCVTVIGPHASPTAAALAAEVNRTGVPTLTSAATEAFAGDYCFTLGNGGLSDEGPLLADHCRRQGLKRVAVLRENNFWGDESHRHFHTRAPELGLTLTGDQSVATFASPVQVEHALKVLVTGKPDAILVLGSGANLAAVAEGIHQARQRLTLPLVVLDASFTAAAGAMENRALDLHQLDGVRGLDQVHDANPVLKAVLDRFEKAHGRRPAHAWTALGWDLGNVVALGLSQARPHSRDGMKQSLEKLRRVPAAVGVPGTLISFLPWDHRGYKGGYLTFREVTGARSATLNVPTALIA